jgi:conjugal transfer/entry exclusion protein
MTAVQRRNQLLAIFYYQSAEARERRAAKVVEEALRVARKGASNAG